MYNWPGLKAFAQVETQVEREGKMEHSIRYYLLSKACTAKETAKLICGHWGIENSLHWMLDVVMNEYQACARKDNAPANFSILRRIALNKIKADETSGSNRGKFKKAGWDDNFLFKLITQN